MDNGEKEEINLNDNKENMKEIQRERKRKWQKACREREKKYPTFYNPKAEYYNITEKRCRFCTRTVYCDPHHVDKDGVGVYHDRRIEKGDSKSIVRQHGTHCIGIWGTYEEKEICRKLREEKGMPDPWYNKDNGMGKTPSSSSPSSSSSLPIKNTPDDIIKLDKFPTQEKNLKDTKIIPEKKIAPVTIEIPRDSWNDGIIETRTTFPLQLQDVLNQIGLVLRPFFS